MNPWLSQAGITWQSLAGLLQPSNSWHHAVGPWARGIRQMSALSWTLLLWGLIWNRDWVLYYLKHVISLLLSLKRWACFKTMWILTYDAFCCQLTARRGCFCLTSIKNSGRKLFLGCICMLFYYVSSGIKIYRNRNLWWCEHIKGMDAEVLRVWLWKSRKLLFLVYIPLPSHEIHWL